MKSSLLTAVGKRSAIGSDARTDEPLLSSVKKLCNLILEARIVMSPTFLRSPASYNRSRTFFGNNEDTMAFVRLALSMTLRCRFVTAISYTRKRTDVNKKIEAVIMAKISGRFEKYSSWKFSVPKT